MALNESEIKQVVDQLFSILRDNELDWVADQIEEAISEGIVTSKSPRQLGIRRDVFYEEVPFRTPITQKLILVEEYSAEQQLNLAIDSIDRAVVQIYQLTQDTFQFLNKHIRIFREIEFRSELNETKDHSVTKANLDAKTEQITKLKNLLSELRKEI
jgi:hypothetical protein